MSYQDTKQDTFKIVWPKFYQDTNQDISKVLWPKLCQGTLIYNITAVSAVLQSQQDYGKALCINKLFSGFGKTT